LTRSDYSSERRGEAKGGRDGGKGRQLELVWVSLNLGRRQEWRADEKEEGRELKLTGNEREDHSVEVVEAVRWGLSRRKDGQLQLNCEENESEER